jgi:hypothetical protein
MQKNWFFSFLVAIVGLGALLWVFDGSGGVESRPSFEQSSFSIINAKGERFSFKAEVAQSKKEQAYGLMFMRSMPEDKGMIFTFSPPSEAVFWMKNTLIPLDILFVRPDGTIGLIVASAQPQDMTPIRSQEPISAVIEINGGLSKKVGLETGDKVESPIIQWAQ